MRHGAVTNVNRMEPVRSSANSGPECGPSSVALAPAPVARGRVRPQSVLAEQLYGARLRSPVARFLGKGHAGARGQPGKAAVEHAVAVKVDLAAVAGLEKSEFARGIETNDRSDRRPFVLLHHSLELANMNLQAPARPLEGVVDRKCQIGMPPVRLRSAADIDLPPVRQREVNIHLVKSAVLVMAARTFQRDPTTRHATIAVLELRHMLGDGVVKRRRAGHALEIDFERSLHDPSPEL